MAWWNEQRKKEEEEEGGEGVLSSIQKGDLKPDRLDRLANVLAAEIVSEFMSMAEDGALGGGKKGVEKELSSRLVRCIREKLERAVKEVKRHG